MTCIELDYQLAELPSAQHRAGLAGLVLIVNELRQQPWFYERDNPVVEFINITEYSATLKLNLEGLKALLDLTYKALIKESATNKKRKKTVNKKKVDREPDRIDEGSDKPFVYQLSCWKFGEKRFSSKNSWCKILDFSGTPRNFNRSRINHRY